MTMSEKMGTADPEAIMWTPDQKYNQLGQQKCGQFFYKTEWMVQALPAARHEEVTKQLRVAKTLKMIGSTR